MRRAALSLCITILLAPAILAADLAAQQAPVPDVRSQFLPDALRLFERAGFSNIRIARQRMDDLPTDLVVWQYPNREELGPVFDRPMPTSRPIVLVVVEPLETPTTVDTVLITRVDTVLITRADTIVDIRARVDTVLVARAVIDTVLLAGNGDGSGIPLALAAIVMLGGLGLGGLLGYTLSGKLPPLLRKPRTPSFPADEEQRLPSAKPRGMPEFVPVIVDEAVWVTRGRADIRTGDGRAPQERGP
jgi:hypothetical protein